MSILGESAAGTERLTGLGQPRWPNVRRTSLPLAPTPIPEGLVRWDRLVEVDERREDLLQAILEPTVVGRVRGGELAVGTDRIFALDVDHRDVALRCLIHEDLFPSIAQRQARLGQLALPVLEGFLRPRAAGIGLAGLEGAAKASPLPRAPRGASQLAVC